MHRTKSFEAQILCYLSVQFCMWMTKLLPYHAFVLGVNHICKEKKKAFCSTKIHCKISSPLKRRFLQYQSFGKSYAYAVDKVCETIEVVYRVSSQTIAEELDSEKANLFLLTPLVIVKLLLPYALVLVGLQTMANLFLLHVREERLQWYADLLFLLTPLSSSIIAMIRRSACSRKKNTLRIEKLIKAENCSGLPFAITMW